jgi:hypothetical protein
VLRLVVAVATVVVVAATGAAADPARGSWNDRIGAARRATAPFHRLDAARAAGYAELADAAGLTCIEDPGGAGAMGVHYVRGALVEDARVDARRPEALLYDLGGRRPRLLGVEYVVLVSAWGEGREPPKLFGQRFHLVGAPNRYGLPPFYALPAWIWHHNPSGMFADWNPRVAC